MHNKVQFSSEQLLLPLPVGRNCLLHKSLFNPTNLKMQLEGSAQPVNHNNLSTHFSCSFSGWCESLKHPRWFFYWEVYWCSSDASQLLVLLALHTFGRDNDSLSRSSVSPSLVGWYTSAVNKSRCIIVPSSSSWCERIDT